MRLETITQTETYKMFDVGELVSPTSPRCPLAPGVYSVRSCLAPLCVGDSSTVFVVGRATGLSSEYLQPATPESQAFASDPASQAAAT